MAAGKAKRTTITPRGAAAPIAVMTGNDAFQLVYQDVRDPSQACYRINESIYAGEVRLVGRDLSGPADDWRQISGHMAKDAVALQIVDTEHGQPRAELKQTKAWDSQTRTYRQIVSYKEEEDQPPEPVVIDRPELAWWEFMLAADDIRELKKRPPWERAPSGAKRTYRLDFYLVRATDFIYRQPGWPERLRRGESVKLKPLWDYLSSLEPEPPGQTWFDTNILPLIE
jgi:hypothetical protein